VSILSSDELTLIAPDDTPVTIVRDEYGVPHIFGETEVGVFYGQGFAVAEDRLFQLEINRRAAEGCLSEIFGCDFLEFDKYIRGTYYTDEEKLNMYDSLSEEMKTAYEAYGAGINTYLDSMAMNPQLKPYELILLGIYGIHMGPWTDLNSLSVGVFMVRNFGMFGGEELTRLGELQDSGQVWFDANRPINDPTAPTTIDGGTVATPAEWSYSGIYVRSEVIKAIEAQQEEIEFLKIKAGLPKSFGSFAVLATTQKSASNNVMLLGCPQMGEPQEDEVQINNEVELYCPTFHVGGMAIAGIPGVIIGHTEHHGWTMTSGISDNIDVYIDSTIDTSYSQYYHNEEWLDFEVFIDTINVLQEQPEIYTHYRTIHGPVFSDDLENHQVYSYKMTFWDKEIDMLQFFHDNWKATSLEEFEQATDNFVMSFNMHYVDQGQNVKYWHLGLFQDRTDGVDPRLPHNGDGTEEWGGFLAFDSLPQADGTDQDYFANWNNKPVSWWNNGDNTPWIGEQHVTDIKNYVGTITEFSYEDLKATPYNINDHGTYQQAFEFFGTNIIDENILPPGQSGFINAQGIPSQHFDDQWPLHLAWEYKDQLFGQGCKIDGEVEASVPSQFCLYQNYPNPFNSVTTIRFDLSEATNVKLAVYDVLGREIAVLMSSKTSVSLSPVGVGDLSGEYKVEWDANNVSSGVYFYHLQIKKGGFISFEKTEKMLLLK